MSTSALRLRKKKNVKKGIQFCLMVCGASGTGRTTFVNTLCNRSVLPGKDSDDPSTAHHEEGIKIKPQTIELELDEEGTRVSLTVVDTPGFGDNIDNEACFAEILTYLERLYDDILAEESRIKRNPRFRDNRVHVLLYFVQPTGQSNPPSPLTPPLTTLFQATASANSTSSSCAASPPASTSSP